MEFFGVGPLELLVVLVIALIVVGPQRLPELAAQMGKFMRGLRRYTSQVTREFNETMQDLEKEYDDLRGEWKTVGQGLDESTKAISSELEAAGAEASRALEDAKAAADEAAKPS
jgi:sec-independent protein translocase protein TatB